MHLNRVFYKIISVVKSLGCDQPICNPMNCGTPGSSVHGILQARILEWAAISLSSDKGRTERSEVKSLSCVQLFVTTWMVAHRARQSMEFSRQEYWSGLPFPSPGDLPHPGIEPTCPALAGRSFTTEPSGKHSNVLQASITFKYKSGHDKV